MSIYQIYFRKVCCRCPYNGHLMLQRVCTYSLPNEAHNQLTALPPTQSRSCSSSREPYLSHFRVPCPSHPVLIFFPSAFTTMCVAVSDVINQSLLLTGLWLFVLSSCAAGMTHTQSSLSSFASLMEPLAIINFPLH